MPKNMTPIGRMRLVKARVRIPGQAPTQTAAEPARPPSRPKRTTLPFRSRPRPTRR